jgi:hypothetical protein
MRLVTRHNQNAQPISQSSLLFNLFGVSSMSASEDMEDDAQQQQQEAQQEAQQEGADAALLPPSQTLYLSNLNDKLKLTGTSVRVCCVCDGLTRGV